jgi:hypothetical protein
MLDGAEKPECAADAVKRLLCRYVCPPKIPFINSFKQFINRLKPFPFTLPRSIHGKQKVGALDGDNAVAWKQAWEREARSGVA